ncbi:MAG: efflux RND transporter periplasmic adaptor subunit, partial [Acidobacteria bacterium]|nr:efflux RND transporter periplasmic adaptor subunit [Acidobacteriota bacterium]
YEAPGTIRARETAIVSSKVMGYIREMHVQAGDTVRAGQLLVLLDARDLEAQRRQASAGVDEAKSAIAEVENAVAVAKANLDLAEKTFGRMNDLFTKKSISEQEFDEANARLRVARAGYEMAASKRKQLQARIAQSEQGLASAGILQGYAELRAPFDGVVIEKRMDAGSLASPGAPLLVLERAGSYRLEVQVEESRVRTTRVGDAVTVTLDTVGRTLSARISEVVPAVDPTSRGFIVKIDLPAVNGLRSGVFGRASFGSGARRVVAISRAAISQNGQIASALLADNGFARSRMLMLGRERDGQVEILSGLAAGERVIVSRSAALRDGAAVEVQP